MDSFLSTAKTRLHSQATKFLEIRVVLSKLETQGLLEHMLSLSYSLISASIIEIKKELSKVRSLSFNEEKLALEAVYRENLKLIFALLSKKEITSVEQVWGNFDAYRVYQTEKNLTQKQKQRSTREQRSSRTKETKTTRDANTAEHQHREPSERNEKSARHQQSISSPQTGAGLSYRARSPGNEPIQSQSPPKPYKSSMSKLEKFSEAIAYNIEQSGSKMRDDSESGRRPAPPAPEEADVRRELHFKESTQKRRSVSRSGGHIPSSYYSFHREEEEDQERLRRTLEHPQSSNKRIDSSSKRERHKQRRNFIEPKIDREEHYQRSDYHSDEKLETLLEEGTQMRETTTDMRKATGEQNHIVLDLEPEHSLSKARRQYPYSRVSPNTSVSSVYVPVNSDFNYPRGAATFARDPRKLVNSSLGDESPGPGAYDNSGRSKSPGGVIPRMKRKTQLEIQPKELIYPGPSDYDPQFRYVAK